MQAPKSRTSRPASLRKRVKLANKVLRAVLVCAAWSRIFVRPRVIGRRNFAQEGALIVASSHRSTFDPIGLFAPIVKFRPDVAFLAMAELFKNPLLRHLLEWFGIIPVYRGTERAIESAQRGIEVLGAGGVVAAFIEGKIIREDGFGKPKGGVAYMAFATGAPVVPVAVVRTERVKRPGSKWWQWGWGTRYSIAIGEPISVPEGASADSSKADRDAFTTKVMAAIERLAADATVHLH
jgi:1-acyl-sn-glycerol-3-phosphate acyltransferase